MPATSDGGAHWVTQSVSARPELTSVAARDDAHAWTVGMDGAIAATTDGGVHWVRRPPAPPPS